MPRIHPKSEILEGPAGDLPDVRRRIEDHLRACPVCAARRTAPASRDRQVLVWRPRPGDYDAVLQRVLDAFQPRLATAARERERAPALLAELLRHPPLRRQMLIRNSRRFHSVGFCAYVLDRSRQRLPSDLRQAEELAALGLLLAESLGGDGVAAEAVEDLRACGWTLTATVRRAAFDLPAADQAFCHAEDLLRKGAQDHMVRAHLLISKASLRRQQGRYAEAVSLVRRGLSICLWAGEVRRAAEAMVGWAFICEDTGDLDFGVRLLRNASALAARSGDDQLDLLVSHNLAHLLCTAGRAAEAWMLIRRHRHLYRAARSPITRLRFFWLKARIACAFGQTTRAQSLLRRLFKRFLSLGSYEAAFVALDLALLEAGAGRFAEAEDLARQALVVLRPLNERDALAAYIVLQQAAARSHDSLLP